VARSTSSRGRFISDSKTVASAGTREALASSADLWRSLTIVAKDNNTGRVYVGGSDVASSTNRGLAAGDSVTISNKNGIDLQDVYLDVSVSGEGVDYYATR
jgi:hypothetical protein